MQTYYAEQHQQHATDGLRLEGHPFETHEVPARAEIIRAAVREARLGAIANPADHGLEPILAVHDEGFVRYLRDAFADSARLLGVASPVFPETFAVRGIRRQPQGFLGLPGYYGFGVGSPILAGTWAAVYWGAQCALSAADEVRAGARSAYALCRPPGHHAARDMYGGFCYLNNAAVAARYLASLEGVRIAILDVDYHHGNGTQEIFYHDASVFFCSLHAHPDDDYPYYWGGADERGEGAGQGYNRNWPLPPQTGDEAYLRALEEALAAIQGFAPRYLVVSAGLDLVEGDPVGGFRITAAGISEIAERIARLELPTVIVQEGGYLLERLGAHVVAFLRPFVS